MAKISLADILTKFASALSLNNRFDDIEEHFNDRVLYRNNPAGEPNQMENDLDMNSNRIINLPSATDANEPLTLGQFNASQAPAAPISTVSEEQTATSNGQTVFTFSSIAYTQGAKNLGVYRNGVKLPISSYVETSTTSITLNSNDAKSVVIGDQFEFIVNERTVDTDMVAAANVTYTPAGIGAVLGDVSSKLKESVSVRDFGAIGVGDDTSKIQAAIDSLTPGLQGGGVVEFVQGVTYNISSPGIVIPSNIRVDCKGAETKFTGSGVAFTLGTSDSVLSKSPEVINLNLKLVDKDSTGILLRGTDAAYVHGNMEGHTTVIDNTRTNIGVHVDGRDVSSFFNRIEVSCNHMHEGFRVNTTGTVDPTTQYFVNCNTFGDQALDDTSIGYNFFGNNFSGEGTVITGGNVELCNTGFLAGATAGRVNVLGTRIEISASGTAWKFDFVDGCDPWSIIGVHGLGTTYMESASGIRNFDSSSHYLAGADGGEMRLNGFDDPLNAKHFIGIGGTNPQLRFDSGADMNLLMNDDTTGTGRVLMQPGRGSSQFGGAMALYGHSHASFPGDIEVAFSQGAGSFKVKRGFAGLTMLEVDEDSTADNTRLLVYDVNSATLKRVSVGAVDSGGTGFRTLRIPN